MKYDCFGDPLWDEDKMVRCSFPFVCSDCFLVSCVQMGVGYIVGVFWFDDGCMTCFWGRLKYISA